MNKRLTNKQSDALSWYHKFGWDFVGKDRTIHKRIKMQLYAKGLIESFEICLDCGKSVSDCRSLWSMSEGDCPSVVASVSRLTEEGKKLAAICFGLKKMENPSYKPIANKS